VNRAVVIIIGLLVAGAAILVIGPDLLEVQQASEEQRHVREKFFGSGQGLRSIEKQQEMRPRW
jgi:type IV secretion system protein TrbK